MRSKRYPREKIIYITNKPLDEWIHFFNHISNKYKKKLLGSFRKDSKESFEYTLKQMVLDLQNDRANEDIEERFIGQLFNNWIQSNTKLDRLLNSYDNSEDFQNEKRPVPPNSFLDIRCFSYLRKAEYEGRISIEEIQFFYEFGYFLKDPLIDIIIDDIYDIQKDINLILEEQNKRTALIESLQKVLDKKTDDESRLLYLNKKVQLIEQAMEKMIRSTPDMALINEKIQIIEQTLATTKENSENSTTPINEKIQIIEQTLATTKENSENSTTLINETIQAIEQTLETSKVNSERSISVVNEKIQSITQMIESIETRTLETQTCSDRKDRSLIHLTQVQMSESIKIAKSFENLEGTIVKNFTAIGLIKTKAQKLTSEILAGLGAGSLITFSGSLAFLLAETCAKSIAAKNEIQVMHIPVGLLDSYQFHQEIMGCLNKASQSDYLTAIIFEGINLSAFECYAQTFCQMITNRLVNQEASFNHVVCFATLAEGPACLPISKEFCHFGPIFHSDHVGWGSKGVTKKIKGNTISKENWNHWLQSCEQIEIPEDLQHLFENMSEISQLWKISIRKACQFLGAENPLESLGFGWLMPRAMCDVNNQEVLLQFCDESIDDNRVAKMLKTIKKMHS
jgi:hypothetical protein